MSIENTIRIKTTKSKWVPRSTVLTGKKNKTTISDVQLSERLASLVNHGGPIADTP